MLCAQDIEHGGQIVLTFDPCKLLAHVDAGVAAGELARIERLAGDSVETVAEDRDGDTVGEHALA